jgi:hypothetical protein
LILIYGGICFTNKTAIVRKFEAFDGNRTRLTSAEGPTVKP